MHLGRRRHGADDISEGHRVNLIMWNYNTEYRATKSYVAQWYEVEAHSPDPRCVSYTHDRDFGNFLDYPPGKEESLGSGWCPPAHACYDTMAPSLYLDDD